MKTHISNTHLLLFENNIIAHMLHCVGQLFVGNQMLQNTHNLEHTTNKQQILTYYANKIALIKYYGDNYWTTSFRMGPTWTQQHRCQTIHVHNAIWSKTENMISLIQCFEKTPYLKIQMFNKRKSYLKENRFLFKLNVRSLIQ